MMVVIGIVAILAGLTIYNMSRSRAHQSLDRAASTLRQTLERGQVAAAILGARAGNAARVTVGASCTNTPATVPPLVPPAATPADGFPWITVGVAGQTASLRIPTQVIDNGNGTVRLECEIVDANVLTNGRGRIAPPAAAQFRFTSNGRLVVPGGGPSVPLQLISAVADGRVAGFRVLGSGHFCKTSNYAITTNACDPEI